MEQTVLAMAHGERNLSSAQQECMKYGFSMRMAENLSELIGELAGISNLLLVVVLGVKDMVETIKIMRSLTMAPILILQEQYDGLEKIAAIEAGADEYIQYPDTAEEWVASVRALIRRYTGPQGESGGGFTFSYDGLCISMEQRRVIINEQEVRFPRREFDLFVLLASSPGRVFSHAQLYREVWGDEYIVECLDGLNSCLRRIRRKLEGVPGVHCRIENRRGVGYCFLQ